MPGQHARLAPSSAYIWMACPGQPRQAIGATSFSSQYAQEGTAAHALAHECATEKTRADGYIGSTFEGKIITQEMVDAVNAWLDVLDEHSAEGDEWDYEVGLKLSEDVWGTGDATRYRPSTAELLVADFKYGKGVAVDVTDNPQTALYGLMQAKHLGNRGIKSVTSLIVQPRAFHEDGTVRAWTIDGSTLLDWEDRIFDAVQATKDPQAPLNAGEHCRWCPAAATCPALGQIAQESAKQEFSASAYDPKALAETLGRLSMIEAWVKSVREFAYAEATQGRMPPGWKAVAKKARRKWNDETQAIEDLEMLGFERKDILAPPKLLPLGKLEKLLGKNKGVINDMTSKISSGLTLVPEDDPRPAARVTAAEDFAGETGD